MQQQGTATTRDGLVIASGYGLKIHVHRGHLVVHDGVGTRRETRRFNRATGGLRRLVVLGQDGYITLDALHWLHQTGAAFTQLDHYGQLVAQSAVSGPDIAKLRRAQAAAPSSTVGVEVARWLLGEKVDGQSAITDHLQDRGESRAEIGRAGEAITVATSIGELLAAESAAAGAYWKAWSGVGLPFPKGQAERLPRHWLTFGQRHSPLTRSTRVAANPANAILNYLYALLEAETTMSLQTIGLDPSLGIFHADKAGRASMSLDVMEACRPTVDAYLLALFRERTLSARDFIETPRGACRLRPAMAKRLAETTMIWKEQVAVAAERVAQLFAHAADEPLPTRLTQQERVAAWDRRRPVSQRNSGSRSARLPDTCRDCGSELPDRRHRYCLLCRNRRWSKAGETGRDIAAGVLRQLREDGRDPAHGGRAAKLRGGKNATHQAAVREWNERHDGRHDPQSFSVEIAPRLREVPIESLVQATGLSQHYCSLIRLGKRIPHQRHWQALAAVASRN
jgi:CRISPR-associated endonuclease Cas1